jgi:predicted P-loop ATPase
MNDRAALEAIMDEIRVQFSGTDISISDAEIKTEAKRYFQVRHGREYQEEPMEAKPARKPKAKKKSKPHREIKEFPATEIISRQQEKLIDFFPVEPMESPEKVAEINEHLEREIQHPDDARNTFDNLMFILQHDKTFKFICGYDRATGEMEKAECYHTIEHFRKDIVKYLTKTYRLEPTEPKLSFLIEEVGNANSFNSVVLAYENLGKAPEENPLPELVQFFHLTEGSTEEQAFHILDFFLKRAALQVYTPEYFPGLTIPNDAIVTFRAVGEVNKTNLVRSMAIRPDLYFDTGTVDLRELGTRDGKLKVAGMDIIEFGEFSARHNDLIKAFASEVNHTFRKPYARGNIRVPRTCSIVPTTNTSQFLSDETGNRRYFTIVLEKIDDALFRYRSDIFPQLRAWYRDWAKNFLKENADDIKNKLFTVRPHESITEALEESREASRLVSVAEERILDYIDIVKRAVKNNSWTEFPKRTISEYCEFYRVSEAADLLYPSGYTPKDFPHVFGNVMTSAGMRNGTKRFDSGRKRVWYPKSEGEK